MVGLLKTQIAALAGAAQWIELGLANQRVTSLIPSQGTAWVAGQVPSRGCVRGNHTLMLSLIHISEPTRPKR